MQVPAAHPEPDTSDAPALGLVVLQKLRLAYVEMRKKALSELKDLEQAIVAYFADEPDAAEMATIAKRVYDGLAAFDDALIDQLDAALNADDPAERRNLERQAGAQVRRYLAAAETDPILQLLEDNPIHPVNVKGTVLKTLGALSARLA